MDHALDAMGDGGGIRGEEARVEAPDAAGRGDRARDQEQAGRIGQKAGIRERLPGAVELGRLAVGFAAEAKPGLLAGLADRGDRRATCARPAEIFGLPLSRFCFELFGDGSRDRHAIIRLVDAPAGKDELAGHEHHLVVALADQHFWDRAGAIDQDQRRRIPRPVIGMVIGFLLFRLLILVPAAVSLISIPIVFIALNRRNTIRRVVVKAVHAQSPLQADHGALHRLQQQQRQRPA